jgi:hypothetical protein
LQSFWQEVEGHRYARKIAAAALVRAFAIGLLARLSGLRSVAERCGEWLGTTNPSSLCHALRRGSSLAFVRRLVEHLADSHAPGPEELVAVDGMALTLAATQRHQAVRCNRHTVGGGVVWAYAVRAARGCCPVRVLKIVEGAWHDTTVMRDVELVANGPTYLMDRGFYAFDLLEKWLKDKVHFIVRARRRSLRYEVLRTISRPRTIGKKRLSEDAVVRLGGASARRQVVVGMVRAFLASGEELILVSDRMDWSAEAILAAYHKRWHVERFHRFLKETLGLAHLYSFHQSGLTFLLYTALLVALVLFLAAPHGAVGDTIQILHQALRQARRALGLGPTWKRNACTRKPRRKKGKKKDQNL